MLCAQITEKNSRIIKHYGIWLRYDSRSGTHNMYREYRDLTLTGAVDQMYSEMAGRHRCRPRSIQIIRTGIVAAKDTKRAPVKQFQVSHTLIVSRLCALFVLYLKYGSIACINMRD